MTALSFVLQISGPVDQCLDELFEAGCGDALFGEVDGEHYAQFDRDAPTLLEALGSAARAIDGIEGLLVVGAKADGEEIPRTREGGFITHEVADELAAEAEAGFDIDPSSVRPGPGRRDG